jgi:hypothetical protein
MRLVLVVPLALSLAGCVIDPNMQPYDPRIPTQTSELETIDPYHRDKIPDTPYEIRKAEIERDERLAGRGGPTYPPLFKGQAGDDGQ